MNNYKKYLLFSIYFIKSLFNPKTIKKNNMLGFRESLSKKSGIDLVDINSIIDWDKVSVFIKKIPHADGHVTVQELIILCAYASKLDSNQNFLEIGTFEGITSLNCALNAKNITIYTLDLPYNQNIDEFHTREYLDFDINLISSSKRKINIFEKINNVSQLHGDSTKFDFSNIDFSMAFIDGGHNYQTVKSDTLNVIRSIKKPGWVFWHDYDVANDVGKLLIEISSKLNIKWIKNTRLCFSYIDRNINL